MPPAACGEANSAWSNWRLSSDGSDAGSGWSVMVVSPHVRECSMGCPNKVHACTSPNQEPCRTSTSVILTREMSGEKAHPVAAVAHGTCGGSLDDTRGSGAGGAIARWGNPG